jgi:signal transduction histidine kinase
VPLFYKLLVANLVIVLGVAVAIAIDNARHRAGDPGGLAVTVLVTGMGMALSLLANAAILWIALQPLRRLQQVADRVRTGELEVRAATSPVADADFDRLVTTFNGVLDAVTEQRNRLREIAARAQAAAEEERRRLARELHDGIAQTLAALRIRVKLAGANGDPALQQAALAEVSGGIGDAILELRRMARGLRPPALEMLGLGAAVESYVRSVAEAAGIDAACHAENVAGMLPRESELALYRIVQEALSNVLRHSGASKVSVVLRRSDDKHVDVMIEDDGCGFDPRQVMNGDRGLGLFGMQERAAFIGGRLEIDSTRGTGTRVHVSVPATTERIAHAG